MKIGSVSNNLPPITPNIKHNTAENTAESIQIPNQDGSTEKIGSSQETNEEDDGDTLEPEILAKSVDQANKTLKLYDRTLELSVHEVTRTVMYKLKDTRTNEVIMEFPPKKIQDMIAKMWELAGLFVDKKA